MSAILSLQVMIFALIAVGFLVRRIGIVGPEGQKNLTDLVLYLFLPCNIVTAFLTGADREKVVSYASIFVISIVSLVISHFYGVIFFGRQPEGRRKCLQYATLVCNAGFIGNPIVEGLYGMEGLAMASVYLTPFRIAMWSAGISIFAGTGDRKATIRRVVTHPCIIAVALGVAAMLIRLKLPVFLMKPIAYLSDCNTAASMLVIGMILARIEPKQFLDRTVWSFSAHRLVLLPLLVFAACSLLPVTGTARNICVILAAMPVAANTSILADKYGGDSVYATKLVVVSTLLSIPTTALWSLFLMR